MQAAGSNIQSIGDNGRGGNGHGISASGKADSTLYLLDMNEGWPIISQQQSQMNTSFESAELLYNYLYSRKKSIDVH